MKVVEFIKAVEELVRLADKESYYKRDDMQLRFASEDSEYILGTRADGKIYLSVYYGFEVNFKFYVDKDGTLDTENGSSEMLLEYYGPEYVISIVNDCGSALLEFGKWAIDTGNYEFKTMGQVSEEFNKIKDGDKSRKDPTKH